MTSADRRNDDSSSAVAVALCPVIQAVCVVGSCDYYYSVSFKPRLFDITANCLHSLISK